MTDEPVISDAEVEAFHKHFAGHGFDARSALAAFLKARVPAEQRWGAIEADEVGGDYESAREYDEGFNACREAVLRGKG